MPRVNGTVSAPVAATSERSLRRPIARILRRGDVLATSSVVITSAKEVVFIVVMVALCNGADHYIFCPVISIFFLLHLSSFFPRLISAAVDWMSTILPHMVWP